jgi:hypothetical protein
MSNDVFKKAILVKSMELSDYVYDDLRVPVSAVRLSGSQPPTSTLYKGGEVLAFPHNSEKTLYFTAQLPHGYDEGENIEFHTHYAIETAGADGETAENLKWIFTHSWSNISAEIPDASTVPVTIDLKAAAAETHYRGQVAATISGTGKNISSILICSLTRDISVANNYAANVYLISLDFHVPINTLGSASPGVK